MKKICYILLALILVACKEDNVIELPPMNPDFIQSESITFGGIAAEQVHIVTFDAPAEWTAEIHSSGDWLRADNTHGKAGRAEIQLTPRTNNFGATSRTATLEIYVDGYNVYSIQVEQRSAATNELTITGHVDASRMTLQSDETGTVFVDTIYVTSTKAWTLSADADAHGMLSFQTDATPQNGVEKTVQVVVSADYSKFEGTGLNSQFYITTEDGSAVPIQVSAQAISNVYDSERPVQGESEILSAELKDNTGTGAYTADLYIESNVRWWVVEKPEWLETSADWGTEESLPTNVSSSGKINRSRQHISLKVKASALTTTGHTGTLNITDAQGRVLKKVYLVFAGVNRDYISYALNLPSTDSEGNPWALEAKKATVEEGDAPNRKRISKDFMMTTSIDYTSIDDAPFHILSLDATNGMPHHTQVHWLSLKMGDKSLSATTESGMFTKQLLLEASERGDHDDATGVTKPENSRYAFIYIVPRNVKFEDLWEDEYTLRPEYADNLVLVTQKNDPEADYRFSFVELADGGSLEIAPAGETKTFTIQSGSYMNIDYTIEMKDESGEWVSTSLCSLSMNDKVSPALISLTFSENKGAYDPFTHKTTGAPRDFRIRFNAFIGDGMDSKTIYTIYAHQELME